VSRYTNSQTCTTDGKRLDHPQQQQKQTKTKTEQNNKKKKQPTNPIKGKRLSQKKKQQQQLQPATNHPSLVAILGVALELHVLD
jgi:hypothetical protein